MQKLLDAVNRNSEKIQKAYEYIWSHPETGYKEWKTHAYLAKEFRDLGYELVEPGEPVAEGVAFDEHIAAGTAFVPALGIACQEDG